jgi:hypothetical protein
MPFSTERLKTMMNKMILMAAAAIMLVAGAQVTNARDYQILPDTSIPSGYVVKDSTTGAVIASWHKTLIAGGSTVWFFHDPSNLINVHLGPSGVIDWNLN